MKGLFLLISMLFLVSCAVSRQQMEKKIVGYNLPYKPEKGEGLIYVVRPSHLGTIVRFNVFLDGHADKNEMGWNRGNQYVYIFAKPGEHTIYSAAENTASMKVTVKDGETTFIKQDTYMGIIMARNGLSTIDEVEGKFWIMNANQGNIIKSRIHSMPEARLPASK